MAQKEWLDDIDNDIHREPVTHRRSSENDLHMTTNTVLFASRTCMYAGALSPL